MRLMPYKQGKNEKNQDGMVVQTIPKALKAELGLEDKAKGPIIGNYTDWDAEVSQNSQAGWGEKIKPAKAFQNREKPAQKQEEDYDSEIPF